MSLKSALGLGSDKKVRYGIVALGDISQESLMPGVKHTGNSVITALVSGDPEKLKVLAKEYDVPADACYSYEQFNDFLKSGKADAIYLATPNWRHEEFAVPALKAGLHVLLEKPMEISEEKCRRIIDAHKASGAKLMIAYRLHFEPATLAAIETMRAGTLGQIRGFSSVFCQNVKPNNHRAHAGEKGGPVFDMGPYPINAVRNLFAAEPVEVYATGSKSPDSQLDDNFYHTVAVTLTFPGSRLAQFVVSYVGDNVDVFTVYGSEGSMTLEPAYGMGKSKTRTITKSGNTDADSYKNTDHFGGELKYFSECVLENKDPEPDGEEGLLDVRVIEAIYKSLHTGSRIGLAEATRTKRIDPAQVQKLRAVKTPEPVNADTPSK